MEWKDLEKMTVLKLRDEALKFSQIQSVHAKNKEQLLDELAILLGIQKPIAVSNQRASTKSGAKRKPREPKGEQTRVVNEVDAQRVRDPRSPVHAAKHTIQKT